MPPLTSLDPGRLRLPEKPAVEGLEDKWTARWEADGVYRFDRTRPRAEVYSIDELVQFGSEKAIREAGKMRLEGKSYVMQDSDVCHFLFNV